MRAEVSSFKIGDFKFIVEMDTGNGEEGLYTIWVYLGGIPFCFDNKNTQYRKEYANYSKIRIKNACKKFVDDLEYRKKWLIN